MSAALLLLPDFALILLGYGLRRHLHLGDHFWTGLEKVVYYVLFPALLVNAVMKTPLDLGAAAPLVLTAYLAMGVGMMLGALVRPVFRPTPMVFASVFQCSFRFNTYVALASAGLLFGAPGIATMALVTGCAVPLANRRPAHRLVGLHPGHAHGRRRPERGLADFRHHRGLHVHHAPVGRLAGGGLKGPLQAAVRRRFRPPSCHVPCPAAA